MVPSRVWHQSFEPGCSISYKIECAHPRRHVIIRAVWLLSTWKNHNRKVHGVPQSQTAALPRHQEEEETDKSKQAQIEQTYEKH